MSFTFVCFLVRSLETTSSCESGRSAVVTLRCNPDMSTKGELSVPRYCLSSVLCLLAPLLTSTLTFINAVTRFRSYSVLLADFSQCPAGTCDGCTFHFFWESSGACPTCTERDYHQIEGVCKGRHQVCVCVDVAYVYEYRGVFVLVL